MNSMKNALLGLLLLTGFSFKLSAADDTTQTITYEDYTSQYQVTKTIDGKKIHIHVTKTLLTDLSNNKTFSTTDITKEPGKLFSSKYTGKVVVNQRNNYTRKLDKDDAKNKFEEYNKKFDEKIIEQHPTTIKSAKH